MILCCNLYCWIFLYRCKCFYSLFLYFKVVKQYKSSELSSDFCAKKENIFDLLKDSIFTFTNLGHKCKCNLIQMMITEARKLGANEGGAVK